MRQFIYGVIMILVMALGGCGSSGSSDSGSDGNSATGIPSSAAEVKASFDATPRFLESYFFGIAARGESINPDTVATISNDGTQLTIVYRGAEIYNETHGWGVYMDHGFMRDGTYIIFLREHNEGSYSGVTRFFVNGREAILSLQYPIYDIVEYGNGWLIFQCQNGSIRTASIIANWVMFKPSTLEIKQFGDYGMTR